MAAYSRRGHSASAQDGERTLRYIGPFDGRLEAIMTTMRRIVLTAAFLAVAADVARAQVIGTFSWTTLPYCNVVTVTVVQQGPLYQLTGSDNLCGAGLAPITGTAVPGGPGVVFGMTAAYPTGRAAHLSASIGLASLSGTWADADGNTGSFSFGAVAGGAARPSPVAATSIGVTQFAASIYAGTGSALTVARSDHTHDDRYYTRTEADNRFLEQSQPIEVTESAGGWSPATGSSAPTNFTVSGPVMSAGPNSAVNDAVVSLPLTQPNSVGGTTYRLSQVEYCVGLISPGVRVNGAYIFSDEYTGTLPLRTVTSDDTDRTAVGCYTVPVATAGDHAYALILSIGYIAPTTTGNVIIRGTRSKWVPVP